MANCHTYQGIVGIQESNLYIYSDRRRYRKYDAIVPIMQDDLPVDVLGVPVCVQCAGNVQAPSIAGFIVSEEPVPPADDGEHLIIYMVPSVGAALAERCMPGYAASVCATCEKSR